MKEYSQTLKLNWVADGEYGFKLQCDSCDKFIKYDEFYDYPEENTGIRIVPNPYVHELYNEIRFEALCDECYRQACLDV